MANNLSAFTPVKFSLKLIEVLYNDSIYTLVANTKYEGEIKNSGDTVTVRTAGRIALSNYTKGMTLAAQDLNPIDEQLVIDQQKYFKFVVDDIDKLQNDIDTMNEYAQNAKKDMTEVIDADLLSYAVKNVKGENVLGGADHVAGTVAVATTTGVVTGTSTAFSAGMVGGYFKATGHTAYYLVTSYASATSITIQDLDGVAYTGGAISSGASYVIKGATPIALTKSNVYEYFVKLSTAMNAALTPRADRYVVVNSAFEGLLRQAPEYIPSVESAYSDVIKKGQIGMFAGFRIISSELVPGNNSTGYFFLAGTKEFITLAMQIMKVSVVASELDPNSFVSTCKGLLVWGRKVFEGNRGRAAVLRATIA